MRISPRPQHQTVAAASKLAVSQASHGSPAQPSPAQSAGYSTCGLQSGDSGSIRDGGIPRGRGPQEVVNVDIDMRYYPNRY